ncbi:FadR/GntR family transcriptional regulator [Rhodococcus sp. LB1]|uniref:FadR/GntR family transcriptional regulator n=1 Tax=Rhodococcus sp. LB1 TaxID=1807499 RepID=UPI001E3FE879|nr:FCD domain-containing protein [Rhodococcus sp. LB1]
MAAQTQLSRTTVREALKTLEVQGLLSIKPGRAGGATVQRPGSHLVADAVALTIRGREAGRSRLIEARQAIEPFCSKLAAGVRDCSDVAAMEEANESMTVAENVASFRRADAMWHVAVVYASRNQLMTELASGLLAVDEEAETPEFVDHETRTSVLVAHRAITMAIRNRDCAAAEREMARHLQSDARCARA